MDIRVFDFCVAPRESLTMAPVRGDNLSPYPTKVRRVSLGHRIRNVLRALRWSVALGLINAAFHIAKGGRRPYQPVAIGTRRFHSVRESEGRWQAIEAVLRHHAVRNVLDVGCAEGWFVRRAATDLNCFAIGIEASDRAAIGELSRLYDGAERMATIKAFVTPDDLRGLPKFDAVICMSVVHHIIRAYGLASAEEFVTALASRADKVLIFEIGTADEKSWTSFLPELNQGQEAFVRGLLERCGLNNVRVIAESPAYHSDAQRLLFAAEPVRQTSEKIQESLHSV
jgi:hypothetical protein